MNPTKAQVIEFLKTLDDDQIFSIYNNYANKTYHEPVFDFYDPKRFFDMVFETHYEAARAAVHGKVNMSDDFIMFNGYGNLESFSNLWGWLDDHGLIDDLAEDMTEDPDYYKYQESEDWKTAFPKEKPEERNGEQ